MLGKESELFSSSSRVNVLFRCLEFMYFKNLVTHNSDKNNKNVW